MTSKRAAKIEAVLSRRQADLIVVLEHVQDPHNIAAVLRTCDAVGVQDVFIVGEIRGGVQQAKDSRASRSAFDWVTTTIFADIHSCFEEVRRRGLKAYATHLSREAKGLYELTLTMPTALVFGNERKGLTDDCLSLCDGNFSIPMEGMVPSLNVSVACAVSLYEAHRQRSLAGMYNVGVQLQHERHAALLSDWMKPKFLKQHEGQVK